MGALDTVAPAVFGGPLPSGSRGAFSDDRRVRVVSVVASTVAEAEEAVQETFARAWERQGRGYRFDHLSGWVATVALNHARSGQRQRHRERRAFAA